MSLRLVILINTSRASHGTAGEGAAPKRNKAPKCGASPLTKRLTSDVAQYC